MGKGSKFWDRAGKMWSGVREFMESPTENSIQRFAWALVAFIVVALTALNWFVIDTLADRQWCTQLTAVEKFLHDANGIRHRAEPENVKLILESCRTIGLAQLEPLAWVAKALAVALGLMGTSVFVVKFSGASVGAKVGGADVRLGAGTSAISAAHEAAERVADAAEKEAELYPSPDMPPPDDEERP